MKNSLPEIGTIQVPSCEATYIHHPEQTCLREKCRKVSWYLHGGCRKFLLLFGRIGPLALRPCARGVFCHIQWISSKFHCDMVIWCDMVCLALALAPSCAALHFWCLCIMLSKSYLPRRCDWKDGFFYKSPHDFRDLEIHNRVEWCLLSTISQRFHMMWAASKTSQKTSEALWRHGRFSVVFEASYMMNRRTHRACEPPLFNKPTVGSYL